MGAKGLEGGTRPVWLLGFRFQITIEPTPSPKKMLRSSLLLAALASCAAAPVQLQLFAEAL